MSIEALPVARAAKELGINRKEIQQKIQTGELKTFEGKVSMVQLEAVFPTATRMESSSIIEKMEFIKDHAYSKRVQTAHIPDSYVLMGQLQKLRMELRMAREEKMAHLRLISELTTHLQDMQKSCDSHQKILIANLLRLIAHGAEKQP
ncbi:MAG: hypothetical protein HN842_06460 [Gammaproteobacteria bacterium]|nr:hypothetical protein [Gammaproteobacteria bacterium]MBT7307841.1 hypothetical protein [Gammaproteobacteria bacterium]